MNREILASAAESASSFSYFDGSLERTAISESLSLYKIYARTDLLLNVKTCKGFYPFSFSVFSFVYGLPRREKVFRKIFKCKISAGLHLLRGHGIFLAVPFAQFCKIKKGLSYAFKLYRDVLAWVGMERHANVFCLMEYMSDYFEL